jgi:hypothetical protein
MVQPLNQSVASPAGEEYFCDVILKSPFQRFGLAAILADKKAEAMPVGYIPYILILKNVYH